jgi:hypothetical protein
VRKNLAFVGHTTTLSDKHVKESRFQFVISMIPTSPADFLVIPLFFLPPIRQLQRWIFVKSAGKYRFLQKRLTRRHTLNMFWINSMDKLLKVRCSDVWWKQCVDLLMYSSELILVDMSLVKVGTEWELEKIDSRDLERKTIFIVSQDAAEYAREVMHRFWPHEEAPPPLYVYTKRGKLLEPEAYQQESARIVSESHLWTRPETD